MGGCLPEYVTYENAKHRPFVLLCKVSLVLLKLWSFTWILGEVSFDSYPIPFGKGARDEEAVTASEKIKLSLKMRGGHHHWWMMWSVLPFLTWGRTATSCQSCQTAPHVHEYRMGPWNHGGSVWVLLHLNLQQWADWDDTSSPQCLLYLSALKNYKECGVWSTTHFAGSGEMIFPFHIRRDWLSLEQSAPELVDRDRKQKRLCVI